VLVLDGTAHGGGPLLNLDDSEWEFAQTLAKFKAKAQGIGKVKVSGVQGTVLALQPGNLWVATPHSCRLDG
jgi:hypothetical protein